jgi:hypothetical protein
LTKLLSQATKDYLCDKFMYWRGERPRFIGIARRGIGYLLGMKYHVVKSKSRSIVWLCEWWSERYVRASMLLCILFEGTK